MLRGEVYARWRDLVASGELRRAVRARAGRLEVRSRRAEHRPSGRRLLPALARAIAALVSEADLTATRRCREAWAADPAGRALLAAEPTLGRPWPGFTDAAHDLVHDWSTRLRVSIRRQGGPRTRTRSLESAATPAARHHRRGGPAGRRRDGRGRGSGSAAGDPGRRTRARAGRAGPGRSAWAGSTALFAVEVATPPRPARLGRRRPRSPAAHGRRATARRRPAPGRARRGRRVNA